MGNWKSNEMFFAKKKIKDEKIMWTIEEDKILKENYSDLGAESLLPLLSEKSMREIQRRAGQFKLYLSPETKKRNSVKRILRAKKNWMR